MKEEEDEKDRLRRLEKGRQAAEELQKTSTRNMSFSARPSAREGDLAGGLSGRISPEGNPLEEGELGLEEEIELVTGKAAREKARLKNLLLAAWDGIEVEEIDESANFVGWRKNYVKLAGSLEKLTEHK
jgi:hypothetical protein